MSCFRVRHKIELVLVTFGDGSLSFAEAEQRSEIAKALRNSHLQSCLGKIEFKGAKEVPICEGETSPDGLHEWKKVGEDGDSNELFECVYCKEEHWD